MCSTEVGVDTVARVLESVTGESAVPSPPVTRGTVEVLLSVSSSIFGDCPRQNGTSDFTVVSRSSEGSLRFTTGTPVYLGGSGSRGE